MIYKAIYKMDTFAIFNGSRLTKKVCKTVNTKKSTTGVSNDNSRHSGLVPGYTKIAKLKFDQPKSSFYMLVKHLVKWFLKLCGFWPFLDFLKIGGFA